MRFVHNIPVSQPGEFMYEVVNSKSKKIRYITNREVEAQRMQRRGANVFVGRYGGWVSMS